jgi:hypothetical protein
MSVHHRMPLPVHNSMLVLGRPNMLDSEVALDQVAAWIANQHCMN